MTVLQIVRLDNGDVVLVEVDDPAADVDTSEPIVSIRFAPEVQDMLGDDALVVAEAMLDAATECIYAAGDEDAVLEGDTDPADGDGALGDSSQPVVVH